MERINWENRLTPLLLPRLFPGKVTATKKSLTIGAWPPTLNTHTSASWGVSVAGKMTAADAIDGEDFVTLGG